ncbi:uncharacterized protein LOC141602071 [Silene latifolia]|uniref:uncharacterized protein LOC141602071 n=1 Tax=Silene latifolia TaxID=37657 RepID=UPI003D774794
MTVSTEKPHESKTESSYNLIHVENTGSKITQIAFNGTNYDEWSQSFKLALLAKGKLGYIDGTISKPPDSDSNIESWRSANALVTLWIYNAHESDIRKQVSLRPEAKQVWDNIKTRFCQANDARVYRLQADLIACRQGPTESLMSYYGRITTLWDEKLENHPLPSCSCNPCRCDLVTVMDARREKKRVRDFLLGLDERFYNARSHILGTNPLPNLNFAYNRLLQEEGVRNLTAQRIESKPEPMAFATRINQGSRGQGGVRNDPPPTGPFLEDAD